MKLSRNRLKRIIKEELFQEDEEWQATDDDGGDLVVTEVQTLVQEFVAKVDELATSVGFVPMSKEPAVMSGLKDYTTDLAHQLRGHMPKPPTRV